MVQNANTSWIKFSFYAVSKDVGYAYLCFALVFWLGSFAQFHVGRTYTNGMLVANGCYAPPIVAKYNTLPPALPYGYWCH